MRQRGKGKLTARQKRSHGTYRRPEPRVVAKVERQPAWFQDGNMHRPLIVDVLKPKVLESEPARKPTGHIPRVALWSAGLLALGGAFGLGRRR